MKNLFRVSAILTFATITTACFAGEPTKFETAYENAKSNGRPLIAVLGTKWCPGCVVLKEKTIPQLLKNGKLQDVELAHIDIDQQKAIAKKLQRGPMIPQVVKMQWDGKSWKVSRLQSNPTAESFSTFATSEDTRATNDPTADASKLIAKR